MCCSGSQDKLFSFLLYTFFVLSLRACINYFFPPLVVSSDPYTVPHLRGYLQRRGQLNVEQTPFEKIRPPNSAFKSRGVGMSGFICGRRGVAGGRFSRLPKTGHNTTVEVHVSGILGRRWWRRRRGEPNSRQGHVPVRGADNGGVNPSPFHRALTPSRGLYRTQWGEDKRPGLFLHSARH